MSGNQMILLGGSQAPVVDPYFDYTTLLLPGNGTNGAQNNTFLDGSTNNFTITRNGNTTQGTFSPFSQTGWSNYFDGSGDNLTVPDNAAFTIGSGDFTIEMWVYMTSSNTQYLIWNGNNMGSNATAAFYISIENFQLKGRIQSSSTAYTATSSALAVPNHSWSHIALVRNGNTLTNYINGVANGTADVTGVTANDSTESVKIGDYTTAGGGLPFIGYISNLRFVKGTAVYTANFTPPTAPLTAITNTSLLTCQSNRFIDNSTNAFAITRNGDTSVQAFSPFNPTAAWSAATYGGSGYFDGSGDYLSGIGTTSSFNFMHNSTALWTFECWAYLPSPSTNQYILDNSDGTTTQIGVYIGIESSKLIFTITRGSSGTWVATGSSTDNVPANQWVHLAITYDQSLGSNNGKLYINGVASGTANKTANAPSASNASNAMRIGAFAAGSGPLTGYLSNLRISNSIVYSSAFTPPTSPVTGGSLLLNFTNAGIYDATSKNDLETVGNAQISTTQSKFGGSSMSFDGTGDYLFPNVGTPNLYAYGAGDFTIEMWFYVNAFTNIYTALYDARPTSTQGFYPNLSIENNGKIYFYVNSSLVISSSTSAISTGTWYHVAVAKSGSSTKMFLDGSQVGSTYTDTNTYLNVANRPIIGGAGSTLGNDSLNGYINDLRITKGIARYTSAFTPPTTAFPLL